jgi:hypothetical protein
MFHKNLQQANLKLVKSPAILEIGITAIPHEHLTSHPVFKRSKKVYFKLYWASEEMVLMECLHRH